MCVVVHGHVTVTLLSFPWVEVTRDYQISIKSPTLNSDTLSLSLSIHSQTGGASHISKTDEESALNQILQKTAK